MNFSTARLLGVLFGVPILGYASYSLVQAKRSESWPSLPAVVTPSETQGAWDHRTLNLAVSYRVADHSYLCSRVEYGRRTGSRDGFRYWPGASARVFYDPADPAQCVLEPGVGGIIAFELVLGFSFAMMGLYSHGRLRSAKKKPSA